MFEYTECVTKQEGSNTLESGQKVMPGSRDVENTVGSSSGCIHLIFENLYLDLS